MSKEKKKTILLTIGLALVAIVLIGVFIFVEFNKLSPKESRELMKGFNNVYNSNNREIVYYSSSTCHYCELQSPILELIADDYELDYYKIDSNVLSDFHREKVLKKLGIEGATPVTIIVENGKVIATKEGYTDGQELIKFFKENKIVPKDAIYSAEKNITFINYDEYKKIIKNDDTNIVVIGQTSCSHCASFKPALNDFSEDFDLTINYLNLTELTSEESTKFRESLKEIKYDDPDFVSSGSFGTPLTLIIKNGKVTDYISGERTYSQLSKTFSKLGIIEE